MTSYLFCLGCVSRDFAKDETKEITSNGFAYGFPNGYDSTNIKTDLISASIC